jgi:midasin (ATPase involved in ribosome maturation)
VGPQNFAAQANGVNDAVELCDVRSLETQRDRYISSSRQVMSSMTGDASASSTGHGGRSNARSGGAAAGAAGDRTTNADVGGSNTVNGYYSESQEIVSRINRFDAEVDAQYRSVIANCRAYSMCMQQNYYQEGECRSSAARWERSEREFVDLSRELREIEAEVEKIRIVAQRGKRHGHKKKPHLNRCDCASSVGGVFSNCCTDRRY